MLPKQGTGNNPLTETFAKNVSSHVASGLFAGGSSKKDPLHSTVGMGPTVAIKKGDGQATVLAKMFRFMINETKDKKKQEAQDRKFRKLEEESKEKRNQELTEALVGKGPTPEAEKEKPTNWLAFASFGLGIGALLFAPDALAKVQELAGAFDTSGISEKFRSIADILSKIGDVKSPSFSGLGPMKPTQYDELFKKYETEYNIPTGLLKSITKVESGFDPRATSPKGAKGLMQLMPDTAAGLGVTDAYDPEQNIRGGAKYISRLIKKYGDIATAVSAYNAGEGNMAKYGNKVPFKETQEYTKKVMGYYQGGSPMGDSIDLVEITSKSGASTKVNKQYASNFQGFINDLEATGYKVNSLSGYNNRENRNNPSVMSYHAMGASIDINPEENPNQSTTTNLPPITGKLAEKWGLGWGMNWKSVKDPMHFSVAKQEGGSIDIPRGSFKTVNVVSAPITPKTIPEAEKKPTTQGSTTVIEKGPIVVAQQVGGGSTQSNPLRNNPRGDRPAYATK